MAALLLHAKPLSMQYSSTLMRALASYNYVSEDSATNPHEQESNCHKN